MNDSTNQTQTRAYQNGILAAKGVRWAGKKLKMLDKACVASAKRKEWPGWLGHIPFMSMALAIIALLAYFSLEILFTVGFLVIVFSVAANMGGGDFYDESLQTTNEDEDGYRAGYSGYGYYMEGIRIDNDDD